MVSYDKQMKERLSAWRHVTWRPDLSEGSVKASLKRDSRMKIPRVMFHYRKEVRGQKILDKVNGT